MKPSWINDAFFYQIYPLGLCGAPELNNLGAPVEHRLDQLFPWLDHIQTLGANAIYLGPVFQSTSHGYDTADYYQVDRRLGDNDTLVRFVEHVHQRDMKLVLDGVFNHVGRDFWAFKDVQALGENSNYRDWFQNLRFGVQNPEGDPFTYDAWQGHTSLVNLNLSHPQVKAHLFDAVLQWMETYDIDGLRLDAADCLDFQFMRELRDLTKSRQPDFWLMGEVVHGDYRDWANPDTLDSTTNYEVYKGLYSSLNDANFFEIGHSLKRQFGDGGLYRDLYLYNFVDNHDVNRIASTLTNPALLYPIYLLLFTIPGIPSVYYGSEWGIMGMKGEWSDASLRPAFELSQMTKGVDQHNLESHIRKLAHIRSGAKALRLGQYQELFVDPEQIAFLRKFQQEYIVVVVNSADSSTEIEVNLPWQAGELVDCLNDGQSFQVRDGRCRLPLDPAWGRILKRK